MGLRGQRGAIGPWRATGPAALAKKKESRSDSFFLIVDSEVRGTTLQKLIVDSEVRGKTLQKLIIDSEVRGTTLQKLIVSEKKWSEKWSEKSEVKWIHFWSFKFFQFKIY